MAAGVRDRLERGEDLEQPRLCRRATAEVAVDGRADRVGVFAQQAGQPVEPIAALGKRRCRGRAMCGALALEARQEVRGRREILA